MQDSEKINKSLCSAVHVVAPGDTLYRIARNYGTDYRRLMMLNGIKDPYSIKPGDRIYIPHNIITENTPERRYHTVHSGDTLYSISRTYRMPLSRIIKANPGIDPYSLRPGTKLLIPSECEIADKEDSPAVSVEITPEPATESSGEKSADGIIYNISEGETLSSILAKFDLCFEALKVENPDVDFTQSLAGITICIPYEDNFRNSAQSNLYKVKSSDSLMKISEKTGCSPDHLIILNHTYTPEDFTITGNLVKTE